MTAAKVLDTISRLPGMSVEANDAVFAHTQVTMSDASRLLKLLEAECPTVWVMLLRNRRPKHWDNIDDTMATGTQSFWPPSGRAALGKKIGRGLVARKLGKVQSWECLYVHRLVQLFRSDNVEDKKRLWEKSKL